MPKPPARPQRGSQAQSQDAAPERSGTDRIRTKAANDPRFAKLRTDPRFQKLAASAAKPKTDYRFAQVMRDSGFGRETTVDKYGRPLDLALAEESDELTTLESEHDSSVSESHDETVVKPNTRVPSDDSSDALGSDEEVPDKDQARNMYDLARGIGVLSSSDESYSSDDDDKETDKGPSSSLDEFSRDLSPGLLNGTSSDDEAATDDGIPLGEPTRRFAVVRMDWTHVKAGDLYKVFSAFKPPTGVIYSVKIYPSEFGKQQMAMETTEGPVAQLNGRSLKTSVVGESDDEVDRDKGEIGLLFEFDDGEDYDQKILRRYELDKLNYYYAVVECDSVATAQAIYTACDKTEFESSATLFDLRYIPDDVDFTEDEVKEVATSVPVHYQGKDFTSDVLQHSRLRLKWDDDDPDRLNLTHRKFTEDEAFSMDLSHLVAMSSSDEFSDDDSDGTGTSLAQDSDSDADNVGQPKPLSRAKARLREKYLAMLSGEAATNAYEDERDDIDQDMEITFNPGLGSDVDEDSDESTQSEPNNALATRVRAQAKQRERRQQVKLAGRRSIPADDKLPATSDDDAGAPSAAHASHKQSKRTRSLQTKEDEAREQAKLDLLLMDEHDGEDRHFDMASIIKNEKNKRRRRRKRNKHEQVELQDDFHIDVNDTRFAAVHDSHQFAIDPTNPQFKKTKAMESLLQERRKRQRLETDGLE
ncbi:pre-rRNA-processing protein esf1 [Dimargaris xerosporica]|nr:pre-rRNA-processing protein esf1 [Dimargaris xerosporica]